MENENLENKDEKLSVNPANESMLPQLETVENKIQPVEDLKPEEGKKTKKSKRKIGRRVFWLILVLILVYVGYSLSKLFLLSDNAVRQIYLVPKDASIIIQTDDPLNNWKTFSDSKPWSTLKKSESFAELSESVEALDSMLNANKKMLSLVGKRDLTISMHKTKSTDWDFLIIADLKKVSKMKLLLSQAEQLFKFAGFEVTRRKFQNTDILELYDPESRDILYISFVENHLIASYTGKLIESSILELNDPLIGREALFIEAERMVSNKGLCKLFINYKNLPDFLGIYLTEQSEYLQMISKSMDFAGLSFGANDDNLTLTGNTFLNENPEAFISALLTSGKKRMKAHEILSARTAFYTNISFDNAVDFVKRLEAALEQNDKNAYESYKKTYNRLESFFDIDLQKVFLNWMSGEFAITQSEPGLLGEKPELILCVHARNIRAAKSNMDYLGEKIRKRVPLKINKADYKGYEINYIELGGFFRLFFGKMFDSFEKPYYTYVDDYVVFSNTPGSLLSFIEDYEQKNLLKNDEKFMTALANVNANSSYFVYADTHKFFPLLPAMLTPKSWIDLQKNKEVLYSFPQCIFQLTGGKQDVGMKIVMEYDEYKKEENIVEKEIVEQIIEEDAHEAENEKELMNELKKFHVEHFEGNVFREFYENGQLKSESEVKEGKRNGKHREYYENGSLKLRGQYINNQKKGTWKYYTEEGKFDKREKFKL